MVDKEDALSLGRGGGFYDEPFIRVHVHVDGCFFKFFGEDVGGGEEGEFFFVFEGKTFYVVCHEVFTGDFN